MNPFLAYFLAQGRSVHTFPEMLVNWYAKKKRRYAWAIHLGVMPNVIPY